MVSVTSTRMSKFEKKQRSITCNKINSKLSIYHSNVRVVGRLQHSLEVSNGRTNTMVSPDENVGMNMVSKTLLEKGHFTLLNALLLTQKW